MSARLRFAAITGAVALLVGFAVAHRILFEPGIVGLERDWAIPPAGTQMAALARQTFDGWYLWTLGRPSVYATDYPVEFLFGAIGALGASGEALTKGLIVFGPAAAFAAAIFLGRSLGMARTPAMLCGLVYALNPVVLNKLAAGQLSFIAGYAFFPLALGAFARAVASGAWLRGGLATGAALGLAAVQIQLGFLDSLIVGLAAVAFWRRAATVRLRALCVALATLGIIELPVIYALWANYGFLPAIREGIRGGISWVGSNSVAPAEALKLTGYIVQYDVHALAAWYGAWSAAAFVVAACALAGLFFAPRDVAVACVLIGVSALLVVTGVYSPAAPLLLWLFEHVTQSAAFLELYDVMAALALVYAIGFGFFFAALRGKWAPAARIACAAVLLAFVAPMLSGDCGGQLAVHRYGGELSAAYEQVRHDAQRVVWFPMDQPLSFNGAGAGIEPMWVTGPGSLWRYSLTWPLTAVDMTARSADWEGLTAELKALGVATVVQRSAFRSELWLFLPGKDRHTYLQSPLNVPPLSPDTASAAPGVRIDKLEGSLPLAYAGDGVAYVPRRLAAIAAFSSSGFVPVGFERSSPRDVPHVVLYDAQDRLDEMLRLAGQPAVKLPEEMIDATEGFAPFAWWWWYRPELGDAPEGSFAIGKQRCILSAPRDLESGQLVLSWIGMPEGGRVRITTRGRTQTFDTNAPKATWRSASMTIAALRTGDPIVLDALDASASVAIRAVRLVTDDESRRASEDFDELLRSARFAGTWSTPKRPYAAPRAGSGTSLGTSSVGKEYRVRFAYRAGSGGSAGVVDAKGNAVAFLRLRSGSGMADLSFMGIGVPLFLAQSGAQIARWTLASRDRADAGLPPGMPATRRVDGETGRLSARFASVPRVAVLNVAFWNNWEAAPDARHFPTALGTNGWLVARPAEPLRITDGQELPFHLAHALGMLVLIVAGCAPFVGRPRVAWR